MQAKIHSHIHYCKSDLYKKNCINTKNYQMQSESKDQDFCQQY